MAAISLEELKKRWLNSAVPLPPEERKGGKKRRRREDVEKLAVLSRELFYLRFGIVNKNKLVFKSMYEAREGTRYRTASSP